MGVVRCGEAWSLGQRTDSGSWVWSGYDWGALYGGGISPGPFGSPDSTRIGGGRLLERWWFERKKGSGSFRVQGGDGAWSENGELTSRLIQTSISAGALGGLVLQTNASSPQYVPYRVGSLAAVPFTNAGDLDCTRCLPIDFD